MYFSHQSNGELSSYKLLLQSYKQFSKTNSDFLQTSDETNPEKSKAEWCIHLRNQKLLADVESCIGNINNLEMASASLYYVVNHLPPGIGN